MSATDDPSLLVPLWVRKAEDDLVAATRLLAEPEGCPTAVVCFCAQQCAEKFIKAVLVARGIPFPKTHEITRLTSLLPPGMRPRLSESDQEQLTDYAVFGRYPYDSEPIPLAEARRAVRLARRVRTAMRKHLP